MVQQDINPASNPDWLRKVEQAERSGDFFPEDSVIFDGDKIQDPLIYDGVIVRPVYTNEDFQGIQKEPVTPTSTPKPEHPTETIRTQPGSRRIYRPNQTEIVIDQLIKQGNKAPDKSGTILRAIAAAGNIVPHIPVGVGMVGRETVEAGERFYNRSWSQRGEAALMWWEKIALAVPNLNPYSIAKNSTDAAIRGYSSYLYDPEPFNSFALDGSQKGLSAQLGIGIGKNLTYAAASSVAAAPFAGGGSLTTVFNNRIPGKNSYLNSITSGDEITKLGNLDDLDDIEGFNGNFGHVILNPTGEVSLVERSLLDEAVQIYPGNKKLDPSLPVIRAEEIMSPTRRKMSGLTIVNWRKGGIPEEVFLTSEADLLTYLDEGGHVAGAVRNAPHIRIYGYLVDDPVGREKFIRFINRHTTSFEERADYYYRAVEKLSYAEKHKK